MSFIYIHGIKYDVSDYLIEHPGGPEIIQDVMGKDVTEEFEDVGHSREAYEVLETLKCENNDKSSFEESSERSISPPNDNEEIEEEEEEIVTKSSDYGGNIVFVCLALAFIMIMTQVIENENNIFHFEL